SAPPDRAQAFDLNQVLVQIKCQSVRSGLLHLSAGPLLSQALCVEEDAAASLFQNILRGGETEAQMTCGGGTEALGRQDREVVMVEQPLGKLLGRHACAADVDQDEHATFRLARQYPRSSLQGVADQIPPSPVNLPHALQILASFLEGSASGVLDEARQ